MIEIESNSIQGIKARIAILDIVISWLNSDDPMLLKPRYTKIKSDKLKLYQEQREILIKKLGNYQAPTQVVVGLKPAKLGAKVG